MRHISCILNAWSSFDEDYSEEWDRDPLETNCGDPPTREKVERAISAMKNGKMGGQLARDLSRDGEGNLWWPPLTLLDHIRKERMASPDWWDNSWRRGSCQGVTMLWAVWCTCFLASSLVAVGIKDTIIKILDQWAVKKRILTIIVAQAWTTLQLTALVVVGVKAVTTVILLLMTLSTEPCPLLRSPPVPFWWEAAWWDLSGAVEEWQAFGVGRHLSWHFCSLVHCRCY